MLKGCKNPGRHIFPWLPGEAVGLHTGVLTKTFAMTILYLKTVDIFFKRKSFSVQEERKTQVRSNHIFHSVTLRIYIHMIKNSRYSIKPQKNYFRRRRRRRAAPGARVSGGARWWAGGGPGRRYLKASATAARTGCSCGTGRRCARATAAIA